MTYTPMILASCFSKSQIARDIEFQTCEDEIIPIIAQFASNNAIELSTAAAFISKDVDGIDLNCGCPQKWAMKEGIGAALMESPIELIEDMIKMTKNTVSNFPMSTKIRIHHPTDLRYVYEFVDHVIGAPLIWPKRWKQLEYLGSQSMVEHLIKVLRNQ